MTGTYIEDEPELSKVDQLKDRLVRVRIDLVSAEVRVVALKEKEAGLVAHIAEEMGK